MDLSLKWINMDSTVIQEGGLPDEAINDKKKEILYQMHNKDYPNMI